MSLLLRTHAERRWLSREVIPVVRQLESLEELPEEQLPAAFAYLEVIWAEAQSRARETDAQRLLLDVVEQPGGESLLERARRAHGAVKVLRETVARRVAPLLDSGIAQRSVAAHL